MIQVRFFLLTLIFVFGFILNAAELNIIPYPNDIELKDGICNLSKGFQLKGDTDSQDYLEKILTKEHSLSANENGIVIQLSINKKLSKNKESYSLKITPNTINIEASAQNGIFYGIQTLRQLIQQKQVPCLTINDEPSFMWRAYMLDEARYFQGKETVKQILDEMALLKLNIFHWHLTNDAGWRIEIKKYPLLTEIGSVRDSSQINDNGKKWRSELFDGKVHKGFYTQNDIKEIVQYATERYITIIPEISMPGHASAAVAAYSWLGTLNKPIKVPEKFGVVQTVFNPANPRVVQFLHDVLKEVSDLFPSDIIHIGGDEVKYNQWESSQEVKNYMEKYSLSTFSDVQVKFTNGISNFISDSIGKRMMGWNEILGINVHEWSAAKNATEKLSTDNIIHFWKGAPEIMKQALGQGYQIVNSNHKYTYLDYTYEQIDLVKAYNFNPIPDNFSTDLKRQIVGLGCQMWGEWTPSNKEIEYQTYPRIAAFAETGWTNSDKKNYDRFEKGLIFFFNHWNEKGYNFAPLQEAKSIIKK